MKQLLVLLIFICSSSCFIQQLAQHFSGSSDKIVNVIHSVLNESLDEGIIRKSEWDQLRIKFDARLQEIEQVYFLHR